MEMGNEFLTQHTTKEHDVDILRQEWTYQGLCRHAGGDGRYGRTPTPTRNAAGIQFARCGQGPEADSAKPGETMARLLRADDERSVLNALGRAFDSRPQQGRRRAPRNLACGGG
jgi:hypothetical protein